MFFTGLTDKFGQYGAELHEDELKQMIRARNQEYFIQAKMNATTKLHQISPRNMLLEKKLEKFANANHEYSQFQIGLITSLESEMWGRVGFDSCNSCAQS